MALPASQYSVLDAQRIERIDDSTFCCYVGQLKFFGIRVEPVLTVSVNVGPRGPTVKLLTTVVTTLPLRPYPLSPYLPSLHWMYASG